MQNQLYFYIMGKNKNEIKKIVIFTIVSKIGINLKMNEACTMKAYRALLIEIKELNKWRHISCLLIGSLNIVKIAVLLKLVYKLNIVPIKILVDFFGAEIDKVILNFTWECKS